MSKNNRNRKRKLIDTIVDCKIEGKDVIKELKDKVQLRNYRANELFTYIDGFNNEDYILKLYFEGYIDSEKMYLLHKEDCIDLTKHLTYIVSLSDDYKYAPRSERLLRMCFKNDILDEGYINYLLKHNEISDVVVYELIHFMKKHNIEGLEEYQKVNKDKIDAYEETTFRLNEFPNKTAGVKNIVETVRKKAANDALKDNCSKYVSLIYENKITPEQIIEAYENKELTLKEIISIFNTVNPNNNRNIDRVKFKVLDSDSAGLTKNFIIINHDKIKENININGKLSDEECEKIIKNHTILGKSILKGDIEKANKWFKYQKDMYLFRHKLEDEKDLEIIKKELGGLVNSTAVLAMLLDEGIIDYQEGFKHLGGGKDLYEMRDGFEAYKDKIEQEKEDAKIVEEQNKKLEQVKKDVKLIRDYLDKNSDVSIKELKDEFLDQYNDQVLEQDTKGRDRLVNAFVYDKSLSNPNKHSVILAVYGGNKNISNEQKDLNRINYKYFFDKEFISNNSVDKAVSVSTGNTRGTGNGGTGFNKLSFPLLDRVEQLIDIDQNSKVKLYENAYVFEYIGLNRVLVESLGKTVGGKIIDDQTNHRTYIMNRLRYHAVKDNFAEIQNGNKEVWLFSKMIPWFNSIQASNPDMKMVNHTSGWIDNVKEAVGYNSMNKKQKIIALDNTFAEYQSAKDLKESQESRLTEYYLRIQEHKENQTKNQGKIDKEEDRD